MIDLLITKGTKGTEGIYGNRVWLPKKDMSPYLGLTLKEISVWKGYDKETEDCFSFEIPFDLDIEIFKMLIQILIPCRFFDESNYEEFAAMYLMR